MTRLNIRLQLTGAHADPDGDSPGPHSSMMPASADAPGRRPPGVTEPSRRFHRSRSFSFLAVQSTIAALQRAVGYIWERLEASQPRASILTVRRYRVPHADRPDRGCPRARRSDLRYDRPDPSSRSLRFFDFSAVLSALGVALALWSCPAVTPGSVIVEHHWHVGGGHPAVSFSTVSSFPDWAQHAARHPPPTGRSPRSQR